MINSLFQMDASSIVEMEAMDGDESDYETNFTGNSCTVHNKTRSTIVCSI